MIFVIFGNKVMVCNVRSDIESDMVLAPCNTGE